MLLDYPFIPPKLQNKLDENFREIKSQIKYQSLEAKQSVTDFLQFRKYVCGQDTFPHMLHWLDELNTGKSNQYLKGIAGDDTCILAPRNSAKSTFLLQWVAWVIGTHISQGINLKILYISYVVDVASSKSRQIKNIIESERYQEVFPKVRKSLSKWGEKEWAIDFNHADLRNIDESYTLACSGLKGSINSKRAHLIICDDLLKSREEAINKSIQDRMIDNWNSVIRFTRYDGSRAINLGTRMSKHDIYSKIFVPPNWKVITQKALLNDNGVQKSFWEPETSNSPGLSLNLLLKEKADDLETFLLQRQNQIPEDEARGIKPTYIKKAFIPKRFNRLIIGLDLAVSLKKTSDYTAVVLLGITKDAIYVLSAWQEKIQGSIKKITLIRDTWEPFQHLSNNPLIIAVDSNKYAMDLKGDLEDVISESKDEFKNTMIEPVSTSNRGDKLDRIESHSLLFENGHVFFNKISQTLPNGEDPIENLINEITDFNYTSHNDLLDALEVGLYVSRTYLNSKLSFHH
jgi:phage terminase large subunit-like protein